MTHVFVLAQLARLAKGTCLQVWLYQPVPGPLFGEHPFRERFVGSFQLNLEPLEVQNTNTPPPFPKKVFLPGPTSLPLSPPKNWHSPGKPGATDMLLLC